MFSRRRALCKPISKITVVRIDHSGISLKSKKTAQTMKERLVCENAGLRVWTRGKS